MGYRPRRSLDADSAQHRFVRGTGGRPNEKDQVDVLVADHPGPWALTTRGGRAELVRAPGGTSALRKTVRCLIRDVEHGRVWELGVPDVLGALTLKGGAYQVDSRANDRHLEDAVVLCATVDDADALVERPEAWTGSDPARVRALARALAGTTHPAWAQLSDRSHRLRAQATLRILAEGPRRG